MHDTDGTEGKDHQAQPHGRIAKVLHWATAALLLFAFIDNGDVTNAMNNPAAMRMEAYLGLGIVAVFALRLVWMRRFNAGASRLPASAPPWERRAWRHRPVHQSRAVLHQPERKPSGERVSWRYSQFLVPAMRASG